MRAKVAPFAIPLSSEYLNNPLIYLFCQYYPCKGSEQFLFNEAEYFHEDINLRVYTQNYSPDKAIDLPENIQTIHFNFDCLPSVKTIIRLYWKLLLEVFFTELLLSPHRLLYLRQFSLHLNILIGYLQKAAIVREQLPTGKQLKFYCYWFDEWVTIIHLVKRISDWPFEIICRMHGYDFDEAQTDKGYHLFRAFDLKGIDQVVSVSSYGSQYVRKKYRSGNITISRLGVRDYGINPIVLGAGITIVSCSALIPLKRVHMIIGILSELKENITWIHFGDGPLKEQIIKESLNLPDNIKFILKGQVDNKEIIEFYRNKSVNFFINVSELEGIPVSLMEAISFGIPVVGCNICGVPELVNEQTGLLLKKNFETGIVAEEISSFIKNRCSDQDFRKGVREFWQSSYNAEKNYPEFINNYLLN